MTLGAAVQLGEREVGRLVGRDSEVLIETQAPLSLDDVRGPKAGAFTPSDSDTLSFGISKRPVWVRLSVQSPREGGLLQLDAPVTDLVELWAEQPDGSMQHVRTGDTLPFSERPFPHRSFVFPLTPFDGPRAVYLRVDSDLMTLPLKVWTRDELLAQAERETLILGLYFGALLALALYNLFIFASLRNRAYLLYAGYITTFGLFVAIGTGTAFEYLWPGAPLFGNAVAYPLANLMALIGTLFARRFLDTRQHAPRFDQALVGLAGWAALWLVASIFAPRVLSAIAFAALSACLLVLAPLSGVVTLRAGYRPARYYLIAFGAFYVGSLLYLLALVRALPPSFLTQYGPQIGSAVEMVLLSLGLADRINTLQSEKEEAVAMTVVGNRLLRYFPRRIVEAILAAKEEAPLQTQRLNLTVVFTDLTGFTSLSDRTSPEQINRMLNDYFRKMTRILDEHGGTLDKFMGDGVMAFFGHPRAMEPKDQALRAVRAAVDMHKSLAQLGRQWRADGLEHSVKLRVGIHQAQVTVGNFGSNELMSFTAIGSGVNLASRLESTCLPGHIQVSEIVYKLVQGEVELGPLVDRQLKGFAMPVPCAEIDPNRIATDFARPAAEV